MRVCIVTVYNSENCGSYLQADALRRVLEDQGHNIVFYKLNRAVTPPNHLRALKSFVKTTLKRNLGQACLSLRSHFKFVKAEEDFPVITSEEEVKAPCDAYFFGSDTLWNLDVERFMEQHDIFWGCKFISKKKYTYAVSLSNTTYKTLSICDFVKPALADFRGISVRDKHTEQTISELVNKQIIRVCDPTMLLPKESYLQFNGKRPPYRYLLLYVFQDMLIDECLKKELLDFCKSRNLKIISLGLYRNWCQDSIPYSPQNFITLINNADYILTNTFHGTVFSIIFEKAFVVAADKKVKVQEVLEEFNLTSRKLSREDKLEEMFEKTIDYSDVRSKVELRREESLNYIQRCLKDAEGC